jgi:hypothetical protein
VSRIAARVAARVAVAGVSQFFFACLLLLIDRTDEFQLVDYVLSFKAFQVGPRRCGSSSRVSSRTVEGLASGVGHEDGRASLSLARAFGPRKKTEQTNRKKRFHVVRRDELPPVSSHS